MAKETRPPIHFVKYPLVDTLTVEITDDDGGANSTIRGVLLRFLVHSTNEEFPVEHPREGEILLAVELQGVNQLVRSLQDALLRIQGELDLRTRNNDH